MTEQPSLTLEWLTKLFEDNVRSGRQVSAEKIAEIHMQLDLLFSLYARSQVDRRKAAYPAHDAAEQLLSLIGAASRQWEQKNKALPDNQLPKNAIRALGELTTALRDALWYIERKPPTTRIAVVGQKILKQPAKPRDEFLVQVADLFRDTLQPLSSRPIGASKDGPVARMTAKVMLLAEWQMTRVAVSRVLERSLRTKTD